MKKDPVDTLVRTKFCLERNDVALDMGIALMGLSTSKFLFVLVCKVLTVLVKGE